MGSDSEMIGATILTIRLLLHAVAAISLILFLHEKRTKWVPTVVAILIGGGSAAAFMQGISEFAHTAPRAQPWLMAIALGIAMWCIYTRGNMASKVGGMPNPFDWWRWKP